MNDHDDFNGFIVTGSMNGKIIVLRAYGRVAMEEKSFQLADVMMIKHQLIHRSALPNILQSNFISKDRILLYMI